MKRTLLITHQVASEEGDRYIRRALEALLTGPVAFAPEPPIEIGQEERWRLLAERSAKEESIA